MKPDELPNVKGVVAVDTETSGLYVDEGARISVVSCAYRGVSGEIESYAFPFDQGVSTKENMQYDLFDEQNFNLGLKDWKVLKEWFSERKIVWHNGYFDLQMFNRGLRKSLFGVEEGIDLRDRSVWDTKIGCWVLDPLESTGLKETAGRLWGESERDEQLALAPYLKRNGGRWDLLPWHVCEAYAAKDAELTLRLFEYQEERLGEGEEFLREQIEMEIEVMRVLTGMAYRGIGYDVEASRKEAIKAREVLKEVDERLPFKATPKEAQWWFFTEKEALPHCLTTKKLEPSVKECCVRSLISQNVEGAEDWANHQKILKAIGMYYEGWANATGEDGRLRADFQQMGTRTMRFSSERVNLQALPREGTQARVELAGLRLPKRFFRAREGGRIFECDLGQAEARVGALKAGCVSWLEMFEKGVDLHSATAVSLFGSDKGLKRFYAKNANFSLIYGVGPATFRAMIERLSGVDLGMVEASEIVGKWRKLYPEFPMVNKRAEQIVRSRGYVRLHDGRQRWFYEYEELHKAFNAVIQGSIAQFVKRWMIEVDRKWKGEVDLLLQIHDSIVFECSGEEEAEEIRVLGAEMASNFFGIGMVVDVKEW